ncbi:protein CYCLOPS-like [Actinidia eriantha]|uniref:protein CYCLOPS-like n=1 Tax=Actinidia eriantha TaxID=165200 RepID=UPI002586DD1D|nr:protein CYCLOPS-like [Actinidia eriantha]
MVNGGNKGNSGDFSFVKPATGQQTSNSFQSQVVQRSEVGKNFMETEGRGYSDFYRNTSEELFLKSLMESSMGIPVPTMEMLGFKNLSNTFRTDSEELFKSWLTNGENHGYNSTSIAHRTRQASRRMSTELASISGPQLGGVLQKKRSNDLITQNIHVDDEQMSDPNQHTMRNVVDKGLQASNLYLAKALFHSSQPMTRSRSSELRKRYAAMQNSQSSLGMEAMHNVSGHGVNNLKQEFANPNGFGDVTMCEVPNQFSSFMSPSNSSSSTFNTHPIDNVDKVSSVVSMLKGTLERKKLTNQTERGAVEDNSLGLYCAQEVLGDTNLNEGQGNFIHEAPTTFQDVSSIQVNGLGALEAVKQSFDMDLEGFVTQTNPMQMSTLSREPSQSESSAAAPVFSTGFDACDGPINSGQGMSESSRKRLGNGKSPENGSRPKDIRERIYDNLKDDQKQKGSLVRYGSITSAGSVDKGDPTKKRRVERSRKMAEAKERNLTPIIPSDMQSILKRCENLEKEVRSLKLNLSFMNRKDSEQTKQIEELQKQNGELTEEKERLLEEIERILAETGNM